MSCIVHGCTSLSGRGKSLFVVPHSDELSRQWLEAVRRPDLIGNKRLFCRSIRVCENHFPSNCFTSNSRQRKRLKPGVFPALPQLINPVSIPDERPMETAIRCRSPLAVRHKYNGGYITYPDAPCKIVDVFSNASNDDLIVKSTLSNDDDDSGGSRFYPGLVGLTIRSESPVAALRISGCNTNSDAPEEAVNVFPYAPDDDLVVNSGNDNSNSGINQVEAPIRSASTATVPHDPCDMAQTISLMHSYSICHLNVVKKKPIGAKTLKKEIIPLHVNEATSNDSELNEQPNDTADSSVHTSQCQESSPISDTYMPTHAPAVHLCDKFTCMQCIKKFAT